MTDDLERRLQQLGTAHTSPMSAHAVDELETRLLAGRRRQLPWRPLLATAAAVLLLAGAVFAMQRTDSDSLRPATTPATSAVAATTATTTPSTTVTPTTSAATTTEPATTSTQPGVEATVPGGLPPGTPAATTPTATAPPATSPATSPPTTAPPTIPATTQPPTTVPPASFVLTVQRVGDRLVFTWPEHTAADGRQYVLVRVGPAGLNTWPVAQARIAAVVGRMNVTTTVLMQPNTESRRWVLAVVGENRTLLAVSNVAISA